MNREMPGTICRALAENSAWVANHEPIFLRGPTGVGKSFLACTLAQKACRDSCSAYYTRSTTSEI